MKRSFFWFASALVWMLHPTLFAQEVLHRWAGPTSASFGNTLAPAGDVDGDGVPDLLVGGPSADVGMSNNGAAAVLSGFDGSLIYRLIGSKDGGEFGSAVAGVGDMNGDGWDDFAVAAKREEVIPTSYGKVRVFSGYDAGILFEFEAGLGVDLYGYGLCSPGDLNGDFIPDLVIGSFYPFTLHFLSGADGSEFFTVSDVGPTARALGDVNLDGVPDIGTEDHEHAYVLSGVDGAVLLQFPGYSTEFANLQIEAVGDLNGDGYPELVLGCSPLTFGSTEFGFVKVFSGYDGSLVFQYQEETEGDNFGLQVAGLGDVDGDGLPDWIVGADATGYPGEDAGAVWIFSGHDGGIVNHLYGRHGGDRMGWAVSGIGDLDLDGRNDVIISSKYEKDLLGNFFGVVRALSLDPPFLSLIVDRPATQVDVRAYGFRPLEDLWLFYTIQGFKPTYEPLVAATLWLREPKFAAGPVMTDAQGEATFSFPVDPLYHGKQLFLQAAQVGYPSVVTGAGLRP